VTELDHRDATDWLALPREVTVAVMVLAAQLAPTPSCAGTLIADGSFSLTSLSAGGYLCQSAGSGASTANAPCTSALTDWGSTYSGKGYGDSGSTPGSLLFKGTTDVVVSAFNGGNGLSGTVLNPPGGGNVVALDGDPTYASSIYQTVSGLAVGDRYQLTFYQAAAEQGSKAATTEQWQVTFGTTQTSTLMSISAGGVAPWQPITMNFIATSASEVLTFFALGGPGGDPPIVLLADVAMTDIPEPASFALVGGGVLALVMAHRRRRPQR